MAAAVDLHHHGARAALAHALGGLAQQQVAVDAAQAQHRDVERVPFRPALVVIGAGDELAHHRRVVVRRHAAVGQPPRGGFGQAPPLRVAEPAVGPVDAAEVLFELAHGVERRRRAGVAADACDRDRRHARAHVVEQQAPDATAQRGGRGDEADRAAHRGAEPGAAVDIERIEQLARQPHVEVEAVLVVGQRTPLAQAATDGVRAQHAPAACSKMLGDVVHVAPGSRQSVPGHQHRSVGRAPFGVVQLPAGAAPVMRGERHRRHRSVRAFSRARAARRRRR
jgi:hypothetical protein